MKMQTLFWLLSLCLIPGCKTIYHAAPASSDASPEDAISIRIECRNDQSLLDDIAKGCGYFLCEYRKKPYDRTEPLICPGTREMTPYPGMPPGRRCRVVEHRSG